MVIPEHHHTSSGYSQSSRVNPSRGISEIGPGPHKTNVYKTRPPRTTPQHKRRAPSHRPQRTPCNIHKPCTKYSQSPGPCSTKSPPCSTGRQHPSSATPGPVSRVRSRVQTLVSCFGPESGLWSRVWACVWYRVWSGVWSLGP
jgi:hypothetical protein